MSPTSLGFVSIIKALSKCQGRPYKTLFFSISEGNLNTNMLSPRLSTLISRTDFHTCCIDIHNPSVFTSLDSKIFLIRQCVASFSPFLLIVPIKLILSVSSSFKVIALHSRINSSISILNLVSFLFPEIYYHTNTHLPLFLLKNSRQSTQLVSDIMDHEDPLLATIPKFSFFERKRVPRKVIFS